MLAEILSEQARGDVVAAAGAITDLNGDGLAGVEIGNAVGMGRRGEPEDCKSCGYASATPPAHCHVLSRADTMAR